MLDTILFDLDGTLAPFAQDEFIRVYFKALVSRVTPMGYKPDDMIDALWQGVSAMTGNDGSRTNRQIFWESFTRKLGIQALALENILNDFYAREFDSVRTVLRETADQDVQNYLSERLCKAKWVVKSIHQRRDTLLRCAEWMAARQEAFFRMGSGYLVPMTMGDMAQALGLHESTVSRTMRDKYLQCSWGIYPLRWFFSRALSGDAVSPEMAKALLRRLVTEERQPLSDQKLCEEMAQQGCPISRRTVAKYRDELGIPNALGRRTQD